MVYHQELFDYGRLLQSSRTNQDWRSVLCEFVHLSCVGQYLVTYSSKHHDLVWVWLFTWMNLLKTEFILCGCVIGLRSIPSWMNACDTKMWYLGYLVTSLHQAWVFSCICLSHTTPNIKTTLQNPYTAAFCFGGGWIYLKNKNLNLIVLQCLFIRNSRTVG